MATTLAENELLLTKHRMRILRYIDAGYVFVDPEMMEWFLDLPGSYTVKRSVQGVVEVFERFGLVEVDDSSLRLTERGEKVMNGQWDEA